MAIYGANVKYVMDVITYAEAQEVMVIDKSQTPLTVAKQQDSIARLMK